MLGCYAKHSLGVSHDGNGWEGIRTPGALRHTRFPGVHNRPLCHPSIKLFLFLVIPSIVEGSRNVNFKVALPGSLGSARDDWLQLQAPEQFIQRQLNADEKFSEIRVVGADLIEAHFVDDLLDLESVARKKRDAPLGIIKAG